MQEIYDIILRGTLDGRIDKGTSVALLKKLRNIKINPDDSDIAIIGMDARFPKAGSTDEFWDNIVNKNDCIHKINDSRRRDVEEYLRYENIDIKEIEYMEMGYVDDIDKFDCAFFKITPKEAILMDPNQRLFLQVAVGAIEDAGYGGDRLRGTKTGVFVGFSPGQRYGEAASKLYPEDYAMGYAGNLESIIASRISYFLDLKGPAILINTACSSSMTAIHYACRSLRNRECSMAIAGGVNLTLIPVVTGRKIGIESSTSRTRSFDNDSDGTGAGEGVAAILLKPLKQALLDRDSIYAVIKGTCINQDGESNGITAPDVNSQASAIKGAWKDAGIKPETIDYIETHGTGTKLGDPIEIDGIQKAFEQFTGKRQFCAISSVKSNVGHLVSTAGIAGTIKAVLALKNNIIPPGINFERPNKIIRFDESCVYVNDIARKWDDKDTPKRCGISSFGLSGTNGHIILEEVPENRFDEEEYTIYPGILTISAQTPYSLNKLIGRFNDFFHCNREKELHRICYTANTGRGHYRYRIALIFESYNSLLDQIRYINKSYTKENTKINKDGIYYGGYKSKYDSPAIEKRRQDTDSVIPERPDLKDVNGMRRYLNKLAEIYVSGAAVNFDKIYSEQKIRRTRIPIYPFKNERHWLEYPSAQNPYKNKKDSMNYIKKEWIDKQLQKEPMTVSGEAVIVISDGMDSIKALCNCLERRKIGSMKIIIDNHKTDLGGENDADALERYYAGLFNDIPTMDFKKIIFFTGIKNSQNLDSCVDNIECAEVDMKQLNTFFYLLKTVLKARFNKRIEICCLSGYAYRVCSEQKTIIPENAALYGLGRAVGQEDKNVRIKCIDMDVCTRIDDIVDEIYSGDMEYLVAYREGRRYIEAIREIDIDGILSRNVSVKDNAFYLITGGTRGIGLEIADYISGKARVNIGLVSRSGLPDKRYWKDIAEEKTGAGPANTIQRLMDIEKRGSCVHVYKADVTKFGEIREVFGEIHKEFNSINGIVHSAGVAGDKLIVNKEYRRFREVLDVKIQGAVNLDILTCNDDMDFLILFSSITTLFGAPGQSDYTSANSFLDAYCQFRNERGKSTVCINWPGWRDTGMALDNDYMMQDDILLPPISTRDGIAAFDKVLQKKVDSVFVCKINEKYLRLGSLKDNYMELSGLNNLEGISKNNIHDNTEQKGNIVIEGGNGYAFSELELLFLSIIGSVMGLEEIDICDNFFDIGGNSIIAVRIQVAMEEKGIIISNNDLYNHPVFKDLMHFAISSTGTDDPGKGSDHADGTINTDSRDTENDEADAGVIIEDFEPFNDLFFVDCFYNAYFSVLMHYNLSILPVISCQIPVYNEYEYGLGCEYLKYGEEVELASDMGLTVETTVKKIDLIESVKNDLLKGKPVILWIDCYYETIREDTYKKLHLPHTVVIYGFNDTRKIFYILEQINKESLTYKEQLIDYTDIANAYQGCLDLYKLQGKEQPTYYSFYKNASYDPVKSLKPEYCMDLFRSAYGVFQDRLALSIKKVSDMAHMAEHIPEQFFLEKGEDVIIGFNNIVNAKKVSKYLYTNLFGEEHFLVQKNEQVLSSFITIRSEVLRAVLRGDINKEIYNLVSAELLKIYSYEMQMNESLKQLFEV